MFLILMVSTSLIAMVCLYLVYLAICTGDESGAWLFAAFAFLFGLPALAAGARSLRKRVRGVSACDREEAAPAAVRFVPHGQLMTMIIAALLAIVLAIVLSVFK